MDKYKILHSKVHIPELQKNLVIRERLLKDIHNSAEKMVILYGTVGYGKTVLMSHYVRLYEMPCAWYHLDVMDNDIQTFFEYLTAAFHKIWADFDFEFGRGLSGHDDVMAFRQLGQDFIIYINEFLRRQEVAKRKVILVLDDFQVIQNEEIFSFIHQLMNYSSENLKIFLATKSGLPAFAAAFMLRERARVVEMDALAFTESEVSVVLERITHQMLAQSVIRGIFKKVEGWPAGTMFVAQYLKQTGIPTRELDWDLISDEALIQNYLTNELFKTLPYDIQQFLLKTSVLDEISVNLCNYVLHTTDARGTLNYLLQENLFILRVNKGTGYYRYHSLFKLFLQKHIFPAQKKEVLDLAAEYYLREGALERGVECYIQNDDYAKVQQCLVRFGTLFAAQKQQVILERLFSYLKHKHMNGFALTSECSEVLGELERQFTAHNELKKSSSMYIRFFGGFKVSVGSGGELSWRTKKAAELFAFLAYRQGKAIKRNDLLTLLWPEEYPNNAVAMLHNMIYNIRKELTPCGLNQLISYTNKEYTMDMGGIDSDLYIIQKLCQAVENKDMICLAENEDYFKSYWGTWLEGMDNTWCEAPRYYFEKCFLDGCQMLGENYLKNGLYDNAVRVLKAGLEVDAYSEAMAVMLMKCYSHLALRKEARKLYDGLCRVYAQELGVTPGDALIKAYEACIRG